MADYPQEFSLLQLMKRIRDPNGDIQGTTDATGYGYWIPARYEPYWPGPLTRLRHRLRCAWLVFIGKADVLHWR